MRTLYLLRHAKASKNDESSADFERPLTRRGRKSCGLMSRFVKEKKIGFDLVLTSTSVRARETIELIAQGANLQAEIRFDERIYEASVARLVEIISELESNRKTVLLVGHNRGLEELLHGFTYSTHRLPSAALARIKFKISKWSEVYGSRATLDWIVTPKQLEQASK